MSEWYNCKDMKALLVNIDLMVRVIVPDNATDEQIISMAVDKAMTNICFDGRSWLGEGITDWSEDEECPYNPEKKE